MSSAISVHKTLAGSRHPSTWQQQRLLGLWDETLRGLLRNNSHGLLGSCYCLFRRHRLAIFFHIQDGVDWRGDGIVVCCVLLKVALLGTYRTAEFLMRPSEQDAGR